MLRIFLLIFQFAYSTSLLAQIAVSASVDSTNYIIGDRFQLYLNVDHPENSTIISVDLSDLKAVENLDVEAESSWDTSIIGNKVSLRKNVTLQVWDSGYYWIPEIPFMVDEGGVSGVLKTNRIPITVSNVALPDSVQLADIKDILREAADWRDYLPYILLLLSIIILLALWLWWKQKKDREMAPPVPEVKLPAHEIALSALTKLKGEKLWQQGRIKEYQSRLTYIIREYLESRYEIPALESTTDEILTKLKGVDFDVQWKDKLRNILQVADLVKFAKAKPPADFHDRVLEEAEAFVYSTRRQPLTEDQEPAE